MKLLFDFFPILIFFTVYFLSHQNIYYATAIMIPITLLQVFWFWVKNRSIDSVLLINSILVTVFGGLTLYIHNPLYIKLKITILTWLYAFILLTAHAFKKNLLALYMGKHLSLPQVIWQRLNLAFVTYFAVLGAVNLYVLTAYSTAVWVKFKLFGILGISLVFYFVLSLYLSRFLNIGKLEKCLPKASDP